MRFMIGKTTYEGSAVDDLSLKMLLELERETERFSGRVIRIGDLKRMSTEVEAMPKDDRIHHPDAAWLLAVVIWASRRLAGELVSFDEAVDFPMTQLVFLQDPAEQEDAGPKARSGPRAASGRAAARRPRQPKTTATSGPPSNGE